MTNATGRGMAGIRAKLSGAFHDFAASADREDYIEGACAHIRSGLKAERKRLGLDQAALAERMEVGQSVISRIENGTGDIGLKTILRYADALGLMFVTEMRDASEVASGSDAQSIKAQAVEKAKGAMAEAQAALATAFG